MTEKDLAKWLKRQALDIHVGDEEPRPLCRIDLIHTIEGEGFEKLETARYDDDTDPDHLSAMLYSAADHDATTRQSGNVQRYALLAFRTTAERGEHDASYPFVIKVNQSKLMIGGDTEPPTEKGAVAHYMRHDENMHRLMMQTQEGLLGRVVSELTKTSEQRDRAEDRVRAMLINEQELLDRKHERDLDRAVKLQNAKLFSELGGMVVSILPLIAGRLLAGKEAIIAPNARDESVKKFLKSLDKSEVEKVIGSLKAPNQIALMELYSSYAESVAKDEAKKEAVLRDGEEEKEGQKEERQEGP